MAEVGGGGLDGLEAAQAACGGGGHLDGLQKMFEVKFRNLI